MIKIALLLSLSFFMFNCSGQRREKEREMTELVDPIPSGIPFVLKRDDMFLDLSSKLGIQDIKGIVSLSVYIDSAENLIGFKILKLKVESDDGTNINFTGKFDLNKPYPKGEYPMDVQPYYPLFQQYINELEFKRDEKVPLKAANEIIFITRLK